MKKPIRREGVLATGATPVRELHSPKAALKLDVHKAYDRLSWNFIHRALLALGLPTWLVDRIMFCISSVTYAVKINGARHGFIKPTCGIRQGDPLSPYIFILCSEILSANLLHLELTGSFKGMKISKNAPPISHLMYADDLLLASQAPIEKCYNLLNVLNKYSSSANQQFNLTKSSLIHHPRLSPATIHQLQAVFQLPFTSTPTTYLGVPLTMGRNSSTAYTTIVNKVALKMPGWKTHSMSPMGRLTMIKTLLAGTTNHIMQNTMLPGHVHKKLDKFYRNFLWGHSNSERKLHPINWQKVTKPMQEGGLGIRAAAPMNKALFLKRAWSIQQNPSSLWAQLYNSTYLKGNDLLHMHQVRVSKPSPSCRAINSLQLILKQGLKHIIGNGLDIPLWNHGWIPNQPPLPNNHLSNFSKVADLLDPITNQWDRQKIESISPSQAVTSSILSIHLPSSACPDKLVWGLNMESSVSNQRTQ